MQRGLNFDINGRWMGGAAVNRMGGDLRRARGQIDAASIASKRFSNALGGSTWRRQVQQAGMQISDFSVQVAGGQSAILAFTQNAPQFIQNFGAMGGVIAAAVTIIGTFAFAASRMAGSIKELAEETEETTTGLKEYYDAMERLDPVAYDVFERASKAIRDTSTEAARLFELARVGAGAEFAQDMEAFGSAFNENVTAKWLKGTTRELAEFLGVAERVSVIVAPGGPLSNAVSQMRVNPQISEALTAFQAVADSANQSTQDQIAALEDLHSVVMDIVGGYGQADSGQRQLLTSINQSIIALREFEASQDAAAVAAEKITAEIQRSIERGTALANTIGTDVMKEMVATFKASQDLRSELGDSAFEAIRLAGVDITSGVDSAAKAAARLATELGVSFAVAQQMQRLGVDVVQRSRVRSGIASGAIPPQAGQDVMSETEMLRREQQEARNKLDETIRRMRRRSVSSATSTDGGGGGGGGGGSVSEQVTDELTKVEQAFKRTEQVVSSSMLGSFKSLMKGTKSLGDSVRDILGGIIDSVIDLLMTPVFNSLSGALLGSPSGGGLLGMVGGLGGGIGSFEGGGYTGRGPRAGGLDGRGGRLAMIHPNESIYDHNRGQGGGNVTINMTVVTPDAQSFQQSRRQIERQLGQAAQRGMRA